MAESSALIINPNDGMPIPAVEVWLKGFRDSRIILTDSFHGLVFSILNNKPFLVIGNIKRGLSRVKDLLCLLDITDRMILEEELDTFRYENLADIDWEKVNAKLKAMQKKSKNWIIQSIEDTRAEKG